MKSMKKLKFLAFFLTTILLGVCTLSGYDIIYEKMNRLMDKSGLKKRIIDSQVKISVVSISAPSVGTNRTDGPHAYEQICA